jgi:hypothetical protein
MLIFEAVKMPTVVFWVETPWLPTYRRNYQLHSHGERPEDGGDRFLRNVD